MNNIIEIQNLNFSYNTDANNLAPVLNNINFSIRKGEFLVILGHNGSGKSTFAKMLNGLLKPTSGKVFVENLDTSIEENNLNIKKCVGMVFQNPDNQIVASIVEEDVAFGPENLGFSSEITKEKVYNALASVDMLEYKDYPPHLLSGGQKQRVAIAGVLAMEPSCIVFDEATSMLDPKGRQEVMNTINRLNKEKNITIIHITHNMEEAINADRVAVISEGEIITCDTPDKIFSNISLIKKSGLALPQSIELLYELQEKGIKIDCNTISIEETVKYLSSLLKGGVLK